MADWRRSNVVRMRVAAGGSPQHDFGQPGAKQPGVGTGEEQGDAQAAGCESVSVAAGYSFDDSVQAQSAEVVGHSASRIGCRVETQHLREQCAQLRISEPLKLETEDSQHGEESLNAWVAEAKRRGALAIDFDRAHYLIESILPNRTIMGDLLDVQQTSVGSKADLPQCGQVL